jgi:hypothetical protein
MRVEAQSSPTNCAHVAFVRFYRRGIDGLKRWEPTAVHILLALLLLTVALIVRNLGEPHPSVLGDEAIYAIQAKYAASSPDAIRITLGGPLPNRLYSRIYQLVFAFRSDPLIVARVFNSIFFGLALIPLYGSLRYLLDRKTALLLALLSLGGPLSAYTAFFMPESPFIFVFWIFAYFFLRLGGGGNIWAAIGSGAALGALALIKPHALILIFVALASLVLTKLLSPGTYSWARLSGIVTCFALGFAASRLALDWLLVGQAHPAVLGALYGSIVGRATDASTFAAAAPKMARLILGHLASLSAVYALPLLVTIMSLSGRLFPPSFDRRRLTFVAALATVFLATFLVTTSKFTVDASKLGGAEPDNRLHARYFNFGLPLLLAVFLSAHRALSFSRRIVRAAFTIACLVAAVAVLSAKVRLNHMFFAGIVDHPEVAWISVCRPAVGHALFALSIAIIVICAFWPSRARAVFLVYLAVYCGLGSAALSLASWRPPGNLPAHRAAIAASNLVPPDKIDKGLLLAHKWSDTVWLYLFYLPTASPVLTDSELAAADPAALFAGKEWILDLSKSHPVLPSARTIKTQDFELHLLHEFSPPEIQAVQPNKGRGLRPAFHFSFSDADGAADISKISVVVHSRITGENACLVSYDRTMNRLSLLDDDGGRWLPGVAPGDSHGLKNSRCEVRAADASATGSGTQFEFTLPLTFAPSYAGDWSVFVTVEDRHGLSSGWEKIAAWSVPAGPESRRH